MLAKVVGIVLLIVSFFAALYILFLYLNTPAHFDFYADRSYDLASLGLIGPILITVGGLILGSILTLGPKDQPER